MSDEHERSIDGLQAIAFLLLFITIAIVLGVISSTLRDIRDRLPAQAPVSEEGEHVRP